MSLRLREIAKAIPPYTRIADVGCDHGNLIKEAFKNGIIFAQAIDNKEGPLSSAITNLQEYQNQVLFSLSDGLNDLDETVEVIILAGMGGSLINTILEENINKLNNIKRLIIQANRNIDKIRIFAVKHGYKIVLEKIIEEGDILYEIIVLEKGFSQYNNLEIHFGPLLLQQKGPLFQKKWKSILKKYQDKNSKHLQKQIDLIKEVLEVKYENK